MYGRAALLLLLGWPCATQAQSLLRGAILEAESGRPVQSAFVELVNGVTRLGAALTDSAGLFFLRTGGVGDAVLLVRRIGYEDTRFTFKLPGTDAVLPPIVMQPKAIPIDPVISSTLETGVLEERLKGYYHRKQVGAGHFISEERLKNAAGAPLSDVLRSVPGISVSQNRSTPFGPLVMTNNNQVQNQLSPFRRGRVPNSQLQIGPCPMQLFIDGKHFSTQDGGVDVITPNNLVAVEVFRGIAEVPAEFSGIHSRCGVISIWTRRQPAR